MAGQRILRGHLYHPDTALVWSVVQQVFGPGERNMGTFKDRLVVHGAGFELYAERSEGMDPIGQELVVSFALGDPMAEGRAIELVAAMEAIGGLYLLDQYDKDEQGQILKEHGELESPDFAARHRKLTEQG